jgi:basic membrane protein A
MSKKRFTISRRTLIGGATALTITSAVPRLTLAQDEPLKIAFVYVGPVSDDGWTKAHDDARKEVEEHFGDKVETAFIENVPEVASDAERAIRDFASKDYKLIFTTSFGFMDPTFNVAKDFPDTVFVHISGYKTAENLGTGFAKIEEPRYVSGLVAGKLTTTKKLGYVAAFPIPEVVRGINAFTLGVRKNAPEATVKVVWTNTWFDPEKERQAAEALIDDGVDVTAQHQDSPAALQADEAAGILGIGYDSDMSAKAPNAAVTSPVFHWGPFYIDTTQKVIDGTWETSQYWGGWKDGAVGLAPFGEFVPEDVVAEAEAEVAKFESGDSTIYTIFTGPINDNTGAEKVKADQVMTDEELLSFNWFVEGVEGEIPEP